MKKETIATSAVRANAAVLFDFLVYCGKREPLCNILVEDSEGNKIVSARVEETYHHNCTVSFKLILAKDKVD